MKGIPKYDGDNGCTGEKRIFCAGLLCLDIVSICSDFPEEDSDQRFFKSDFVHHGIHIENCVYHCDKGCPTSFVIINARNGSRTIINSNRTLPDLSFDDFKTRVNLNSGIYKWMHFEGRPSVGEIKRMLLHVEKYNTSVSEEERITTSVELEKPRPKLGLLFNIADYVFVSKDYCRHHGYHTKEEALLAFSTRIRHGATLIIPWGEQGAVAVGADGTMVSSPAFPPEKVVDTLGAGDTFVASTIYQLSNGKSLQESVKFGCKLGGAKVGMFGFGGLREKLNALKEDF